MTSTSAALRKTWKTADLSPFRATDAMPAGQTALVVGLGTALGLLATLLPAGLLGRARLTAGAGLRE